MFVVYDSCIYICIEAVMTVVIMLHLHREHRDRDCIIVFLSSV